MTSETRRPDESTEPLTPTLSRREREPKGSSPWGEDGVPCTVAKPLVRGEVRGTSDLPIFSAGWYETTPLAPHETVVLIPAYHEEKHIGDVVKATLPYCPNVLVVDDGSTDATAEAAEAAGARVIRQDVNGGKGVALQTGFDAVLKEDYRAVITMDADGQHDPSDIPTFLAAFGHKGCAALTGNRMAANEDMPLIRRWTNEFMSWLLSREMKQRVPDTQCGYRLYAAEVIPLLRVQSAGFAAESEQLLDLAEHGVRIGSVPIKTIYGDEKSKINPWSDTVRFFRMLRRRRRQRG